MDFERNRTFGLAIPRFIVEIMSTWPDEVIAVFKIVGAAAETRANTKSARDLGRRLGHSIAQQWVRKSPQF